MISLYESTDRRNKLIAQFEKYGVKNYYFHQTERWVNISDHYVVHSYYPQYAGMVYGTTIAHLSSLLHWYMSTSEPYAIFMDDDLDLSTCEYWNFTFDEFLENLPKDWQAVQLHRGLDTADALLGSASIHARLKMFWGRWWGVCALISRPYAKMIIDWHIRSMYEFDLRLEQQFPNDPNLIEYVENVFFMNKGVVTNYPLFVTQEAETTYVRPVRDRDINGIRLQRETFLNLWKEKGPTLNLKESLIPCLFKEPS
jgi:hypothetical protein